MSEMRVAIVRNGVVDQILMVHPDYLPPAGARAIPSEDANIGDNFDGVHFAPPAITAADDLAGRVSLLRDGRTRLEYRIDVGAGMSVVTDLRQPTREDMAMLRRWGEVNPTATRVWRKSGTSTTLTGAQFVTLAQIVETAVLDLFEKTGEVLADIRSPQRTIWTEEDVAKAFAAVLPPLAQ